jgi:hypothetical protein
VKSIGGLSREELAALVCSSLERGGITVVLSGGSAVSIHSANAYESFDLDFVQTGLARRPDAVMRELGFRKRGRHWSHPDSDYFVEFPPGPVQIGKATITEFLERTTPFGVLRILAPTACVMDRLAAFYHWDDPQGLEQALAVARSQPVDLDRVEAWSRGERADAKFRSFRERLEQGD